MAAAAPSRVWALDLPLVSERLLLRVHRPEDLDDLVVFHSDPEVTRYIPWPVRSREQTAEALTKKLEQSVARRTGEWIVLAVEERDSRTVIGEVLLKRAGPHRAEVGYAFRADRHGQGLASEAVGLLLRTAVIAFDLTRVEAVVEAPNTASIRLLERFGFTRTGVIEGSHGELRRFVWRPPRR